ncbi:lipase family alpha/beta hydrolase [Neorhodopirellula lusitana]|uniref:lipase family alpha/beta hydrolase n=1 Tax=Neorhodopirellula lusitana TaxID=445327 RepID=UPI00384C9DFE
MNTFPQLLYRSLVTVLVFCVGAMLAVPSQAQSPGSGTPTDPVPTSSDAAPLAVSPPSTDLLVESSSLIEITVPADEGRVRWSEVATVLSRKLTLDRDSVASMLPAGELDLNSPLVSLLLLGINAASQDKIVFERVGYADGSQALCIRCRRDHIEQLAAPEKVRLCVFDGDSDLTRRAESLPIVIGLHGYQGKTGAWDGFRRYVRELGYPTATVSYDYDQPIARSAKQVAACVQTALLGKGGGRCRVVLVGHSMGGLVAREWTENPRLPNQSIAALITLGSPHGGSSWATMPPMAELFTGNDFDSQDLTNLLLHQPSSAGLLDMVPDSDFLNQLNARNRRPDVAYTAIVGTACPFDQDNVVVIRSALQALDQEGSVVRLIRPRIQPLLDSFDELSPGKGDGMVACANAMMPGCDDTVLLPVSHLEMVRAFSDESAGHPTATEAVWQAVVDRLQRLPASVVR